MSGHDDDRFTPNQRQSRMMAVLSRPAPRRTAGVHALILAAGVIVAGTFARRWGVDRATAGARSEAEKRVRAALRERDEHLLRVAHELKTPLTILKGHAQLLARSLNSTGDVETDRVRVTLAAIEAAVTDAARRLDQLAEQADRDPARARSGAKHHLHALTAPERPAVPPPAALRAATWQQSGRESASGADGSGVDAAANTNLRSLRPHHW